MSLVWFAAAITLYGAEDQNLVLKRNYTYFPQTDYYDSKDDGDITQLTDGVTEFGSSMWMNKSCVGWASGIDVPVVMHFELGEEATLNELWFNTCGGGGADVVEVGLRIFLSLDDECYVPGSVHPTPPHAAGGHAGSRRHPGQGPAGRRPGSVRGDRRHGAAPVLLCLRG